MELVDGELVVSATDLVGHLACAHLTALDLGVAESGRPRQRRDDPELEVLRRRGFEHEGAYLELLEAAGSRVVRVADPEHGVPRLDGLRAREQETLAAMRSGADVVFQATFLDERGSPRWRGHADFLTRVDAPTGLGAHGYEPEDTKLARQVKPSAVLQLCHYAEQVERLQGRAPERVHVVLGGRRRVSLRLAEFSAYYRTARAGFVAALVAGRATYPLPVAHCGVCGWLEACEQRWTGDDHLSLVANLSRDQARKLEAAGVRTVAELASTDDGLDVAGIRPVALARLRRQARLQVARLPGQPPPFELVEPTAAGQGLAALPEPDGGDLFYDIEGDPYEGEHGLEYLHGVGWMEAGEPSFEALWGHDPAGERRAFEALIDLVVERRRLHPHMHVYHYAPYEPSALGRLMGRYGTREDELDDLLRGEVFVDLYRVVRQGLVIGTPSYSLKKLEALYMDRRTGGITDGGSSIVEYERWLQTGEQPILDEIEAYNRVDVDSTRLLRHWLEARRADAAAAGIDIPRLRVGPPDASPDSPDAVDGADDTASAAEAVSAVLLADMTEPPGPEADDLVRARWLTAHLLEWHKREDRPEWWHYFERVLRYDERDLLLDTEAIAGLTVVGEPRIDVQSYIWTYTFDADQEFKLAAGAKVRDPAADRATQLEGAPQTEPGSLVLVDPTRGILELRRGIRSKAPHPAALIPKGPIKTTAQRESLIELGRAVLAHGIDGDGPAAVARQLIGRRPPRIHGLPSGEPLRRPGEPTRDAAIRLASGLDRSYLPIQGPPGAGKTYTAAHVILELVAAGKRVGITANSHDVISHLIRWVLRIAAEQGRTVSVVQRAEADRCVDHPSVLPAKDNARLDAALAAGAVDIVAGTAWLFSRREMREAVHTLVVDEAGQMSLANVAAVASAATNLILVGDPLQLAQPSKGSHPEGAAASGLDHVLHGRATMPDHLGLFLDTTWRMHPDVCRFISEQVYEGRLQSEDHCSRQRIGDGPEVAGTGVRWMPVAHTGNRTSSVEEAQRVAQVYEALVGRGWTDGDGEPGRLGVDDILVVAPYNAQVRLLAQHLPDGAQIGTVDRFQGKEAAVVIISLAASSAENVPRGMEFLYSRNRLNVAVSRARALSVMVASPELLAVTCRTVAQMRLANVLCRYVEMATPPAGRP